MVGGLVAAGAGCGVIVIVGSLKFSMVVVWWSVVDWWLSDWMRAGSCWRVCMYWSSASGEGTSALGVGGAAKGSVGVRAPLSVFVRSTVGLMVGVVLVSGVLLLSFVVPGLVVITAAVG